MSQKKSKTFKDVVIPGAVYTILPMSNKCGDMKRQKEKDLSFLGAVNCGKVNTWGKLMAGKGYSFQ